MRSWRYLIAICSLAFSAACCRADDVITLELPSSRAPVVTPTDSQAAPPDRRATSDFMEYSRQHATQPSRHAAARSRQSVERTVGRLGVTRSGAPIRANRGGGSRVLARVQGGTYVALTYDAGDWYGVLMADRSTGWIRKADVNVLNYEVVSSEPAKQPGGGMPNWGSSPIGAGARTLLQYASQYLGVPYRYGGNSSNGIDCSAFVQRCFAQMGIGLPRTAAEQSQVGTPIEPGQLQAGDRIYFANKEGRVVHTGIYIQDGYFIHASASTHKVSVSRLSEDLYTRMYAGARRI